MKNIKKVLAVLLTAIMLFSTMSVGASAAISPNAFTSTQAVKLESEFSLYIKGFFREMFNGLFENIGLKNAIKATDVEFDNSKIIIEVGSTTAAKAEVKPSKASNKNLRYESDDPTIASINANGIVKGLNQGKTTVYAIAEDGGFYAKCSVNVTKSAPKTIPCTSIEVSTSSTLLEVGESLTVDISVMPSNTTDKVSISNKFPEVANASFSNGKLVIQTKSLGTAHIVVKCGNIIKDIFVYTYKTDDPVQEAIETVDFLTIKRGEDKSVDIGIIPANNSNPLTFEIKNTDIATAYISDEDISYTEIRDINLSSPTTEQIEVLHTAIHVVGKSKGETTLTLKVGKLQKDIKITVEETKKPLINITIKEYGKEDVYIKKEYNLSSSMNNELLYSYIWDLISDHPAFEHYFYTESLIDAVATIEKDTDINVIVDTSKLKGFGNIEVIYFPEDYSATDVWFYGDIETGVLFTNEDLEEYFYEKTGIKAYSETEYAPTYFSEGVNCYCLMFIMTDEQPVYLRPNYTEKTWSLTNPCPTSIGKIITGIEPATKESEIKKYITAGENGSLKIETKFDDIIGTGTLISSVSHTGEVKDSSYVSIKGDLNGDGHVNAVDVAVLKDEIKNPTWSKKLASNTSTPANEACLISAADLNGDGHVLDIDLRLLENVALGAKGICYRTGKIVDNYCGIINISVYNNNGSHKTEKRFHVPVGTIINEETVFNIFDTEDFNYYIFEKENIEKTIILYGKNASVAKNEVYQIDVILNKTASQNTAKVKIQFAQNGVSSFDTITITVPEGITLTQDFIKNYMKKRYKFERFIFEAEECTDAVVAGSTYNFIIHCA